MTTAKAMRRRSVRDRSSRPDRGPAGRPGGPGGPGAGRPGRARGRGRVRGAGAVAPDGGAGAAGSERSRSDGLLRAPTRSRARRRPAERPVAWWRSCWWTVARRSRRSLGVSPASAVANSVAGLVVVAVERPSYPSCLWCPSGSVVPPVTMGLGAGTGLTQCWRSAGTIPIRRASAAMRAATGGRRGRASRGPAPAARLELGVELVEVGLAADQQAVEDGGGHERTETSTNATTSTAPVRRRRSWGGTVWMGATAADGRAAGRPAGAAADRGRAGRGGAARAWGAGRGRGWSWLVLEGRVGQLLDRTEAGARARGLAAISVGGRRSSRPLEQAGLGRRPRSRTAGRAGRCSRRRRRGGGAP